MTLPSLLPPLPRPTTTNLWLHLVLPPTPLGDAWCATICLLALPPMHLLSSPASVGVLRNECAGLCNPLLELPALHNSSNCSGPAGTLLRYHASYPAHKAFEKMWVA